MILFYLCSGDANATLAEVIEARRAVDIAVNEANTALELANAIQVQASNDTDHVSGLITVRCEELVNTKSSSKTKRGSCSKAGPLIYYIYSASPQGQGHHNSVSQLPWARSTYPTLSTFPVGGNRSTRRKPTTFGRALSILLSHEDWVRVYLKLGIEVGTLEVKGEWSDHYTTEAPNPVLILC